MDDVEEKIRNLETKVKNLSNNLSSSCLQELLSEIKIADSLTNLFNNQEFRDRIEKIKNDIQSKTSTTVYTASDRNMRINNVNQGAEKILLMNQFVNECVFQQENALDLIEIESESALNSSNEAYNQLLSQKQYLERKHRFIRNIFILILIFISLVIIRIIL